MDKIMKRIVLISCAKKKAGQRTMARQMYVSPLFRSMLQYAEGLHPDALFILSAKHGLLAPDTEIAPYDLTLNTMPVASVKEWAGRVVDQLRGQADLSKDHFVILASTKYRRFLTPHLTSFKVPMEGLGIGKQLQWLKSKNTR